MRIAVTGATGFVGRALCERLSDLGHEPLAITRRPQPGNALVVEDLASDPIPLSALAKVDAFVHLAAVSDLKGDGRAPRDPGWIANVEGTRAAVAAAVEAGVGTFVFVSSIKAAAEQSTPGQAIGKDTPSAPQSTYGLSKLEAEQIVRESCEGTGTEWVIVRPPLVYGDGAGGNFAMLTRLVRMGLPLPLGAIANRRTVIHVDNLSDVLEQACAEPSFVSRVILPGDNTLSTPDLLRAIGVACGRKARLINVPVSLLQRAASTMGLGALMRRLTESLEIEGGSVVPGDWVPRIAFDEALARSVGGAAQRARRR